MSRTNHPLRRLIALALATACTAAAFAHPSPAGAAPTSVPMTGRVSVSTNGLEVGTNAVDATVLIDGTGRYVFFSTKADLLDDSLGLADSDTNGDFDVYRRDRLTGVTKRVSFVGESTQITGPSHLCGLSSNGRYAAFYGQGPNLPGGTALHVYVRSIEEEETRLGSVSSSGAPAFGVVNDQPCPVDDKGEQVAFVSASPSVVGNDTNAAQDVFVRRFPTATTTRKSLNQAGNQIGTHSYWPALSADGTAVAFQSVDPAVTQGDTNGGADVFVRQGNTTVRASTKGNGTEGTGQSTRPALSANGRYVAFQSSSVDFFPPDTNGGTDVFRKDLQTGALEPASVQSGTTNLGDAPSANPSISASGRYIGFTSAAKNLYPADTLGYVDAFRRDLDLDQTVLLSRIADSIQPGSGTTSPPSLSSDGRVAAFASAAPNLVTGDLDGVRDAFVRDAALDTTPFPSPQAFIVQQHEDFLGQPAGSIPPIAGKVLTNGLHGPDHYVVLSAHSTEWAGKRAPLTRLYWAFFLRVPDPSGMTYWTNKLTAGTKLSTIASQFAASSEFTTKYGSLANQVFVTKIYQNIFDRDPDPGGLAYWTSKLDTKQKTRGDVMVSFSESSEGKRVLAPQADIVLLHLGMLRSMPTTMYVKLLIDNLKGPWTPELLAASYRQSPEYAARVVS